jgi:hypothetical protein
MVLLTNVVNAVTNSVNCAGTLVLNASADSWQFIAGVWTNLTSIVK